MVLFAPQGTGTPLFGETHVTQPQLDLSGKWDTCPQRYWNIISCSSMCFRSTLNVTYSRKQYRFSVIVLYISFYFLPFDAEHTFLWCFYITLHRSGTVGGGGLQSLAHKIYDFKGLMS